MSVTFCEVLIGPNPQFDEGAERLSPTNFELGCDGQNLALPWCDVFQFYPVAGDDAPPFRCGRTRGVPRFIFSRSVMAIVLQPHPTGTWRILRPMRVTNRAMDELFA